MKHRKHVLNWFWRKIRRGAVSLFSWHNDGRARHSSEKFWCMPFADTCSPVTYKNCPSLAHKKSLSDKDSFFPWNFSRLFPIASYPGTCPHAAHNLCAVLHLYISIMIWIVQNVNFVQLDIYAISWMLFAQLSFINHFSKSTFNIQIPVRVLIQKA